MFHASTFEEMAELSKQQGMAMHKAKDPAHLEAIQKIGELMKTREDMEKWQESKRQEFEALVELL